MDHKSESSSSTSPENGIEELKTSRDNWPALIGVDGANNTNDVEKPRTLGKGPVALTAIGNGAELQPPKNGELSYSNVIAEFGQRTFDCCSEKSSFSTSSIKLSPENLSENQKGLYESSNELKIEFIRKEEELFVTGGEVQRYFEAIMPSSENQEPNDSSSRPEELVASMPKEELLFSSKGDEGYDSKDELSSKSKDLPENKSQSDIETLSINEKGKDKSIKEDVASSSTNGSSSDKNEEGRDAKLEAEKETSTKTKQSLPDLEFESTDTEEDEDENSKMKGSFHGKEDEYNNVNEPIHGDEESSQNDSKRAQEESLSDHKTTEVEPEIVEREEGESSEQAAAETLAPSDEVVLKPQRKGSAISRNFAKFVRKLSGNKKSS